MPKFIPYDQRKLFSVTISPIYFSRDDEEGFGAGGHVDIALASVSGDKEGPSVSVHLSVPVTAQTSFEDAERIILESAHSLLARIAKEPVESLIVVHKAASGAD